MKKFFRRLWRSWFPHYILEVTHRGVNRRIFVTEFIKKTPKAIIVVNDQGERVELISVEPMDYYIEEYRDDLQ